MGDKIRGENSNKFTLKDVCPVLASSMHTHTYTHIISLSLGYLSIIILKINFNYASSVGQKKGANLS